MSARVLMVQGTASDVGKSLIVTALCRSFARRGVRVMPFKAQNMSRNAFVTPDGLEIGTAQAVQAEAARVTPRAAMNPILLKPEPGMRSQVIVRGESIGSFRFGEYKRDVEAHRAIVRGALGELREACDLVIIEGAGSPAEINLRARDIANMDVALAASAPVLLVGDIDRGGVYAALHGTMGLLSEPERRLVRGFIINKLQGDGDMLRSGNEAISERTGVPVLGVVPMIPNLGIAEEDSVALDGRDAPRAPMDQLEIAIVRYPAMSNYDEFRGLEQEPGVVVRYVCEARELLGADLVIMPGSKATRSDLAYVRAHGFDLALRRHVNGGGRVLGICGGFQMLGTEINDAVGLEGEPGQSEGLGLLPVRTRFGTTKRTAQVTVELETELLGSSASPLPGYEIHAGRVTFDEGATPIGHIRTRAGAPCAESAGCAGHAGRVVGTMVHGLLEDAATRERLLDGLGRDGARGETDGGVAASRDAEYERVADVLEAHVDMAALDALLSEQPLTD